MSRTFFKIFGTALAVFLAFSINANAQLNAGSFGVGAMFAGSSQTAMGHFAFQDNLDLGLGIGYISNSYSSDEKGYKVPDAENTILLEAMGRLFLNKGKDVSPYVGGLLMYNSYPPVTTGTSKISKSEFGIAAIFGGQVFIAKGFAVYGHIALGYASYSEKTNPLVNGAFDATKNSINKISLSGSGIGAVFYF
jgi:hypothetical protein